MWIHINGIHTDPMGMFKEYRVTRESRDDKNVIQPFAAICDALSNATAGDSTKKQTWLVLHHAWNIYPQKGTR